MILPEYFKAIRDFQMRMPADNASTNDYMLALFMEVAELVDSYSWKPWRESVPADIENLKRELVDIHFFLVHIMNCFGILPEDLNQKFEEVIANNEKRYVKKPYTNPPMFIKTN